MPALQLEEDDRAALARHFDASYYLAANADVAVAGIDPLVHYHVQGWRERRNPNTWFNTQYYLDTNIDVAAAGCNPLLHYAYAGKNEGRLARRPLDEVRSQLDLATPPAKRLSQWAGAADRSDPITTAELRGKLDCALRKNVVLSVSHDDYARSVGGVQNVIADEEGALQQAGWRYLHISPAAPLPLLAGSDFPEEKRIGLRLDGKWIGITTAGILAWVLRKLRANGTQFDMVLHHLMGHAPEALLTIARAAGVVRPIAWIHDFFTLCSSYTLLRNDVAYCGGPPQRSSACGICSYGADRQDHLARIAAFFSDVRPVIMAPSSGALERWLQCAALPHSGTVVQPLAHLSFSANELTGHPSQNGGPLRVAYAGSSTFHKGWPVFQRLAAKLAGDSRYEFLHLGISAAPQAQDLVRHVPVRVTSENRNAMIHALAEAYVDVVVSWPFWPETFNFTVHEALAAGAFVVTRKDTGNVWPAIVLNAPDQGCAFEDESALFRCFEGSLLAERLAHASRRRGILLRGTGAADWLIAESAARQRP